MLTFWLCQLLFLLTCTPLAMLWGGCCCEPGCQFFTDAFSSSGLSSWTQVSGTWTESSGVASTSSSNAVLLCDTDNPDGDANIKVSCTVNIATDGDTARIILDYIDTNNYWFAEFKAGSGGYVRIYQRSGGSNTLKDSADPAFTAGIGNHVCMSYRDGQVMASVGGFVISTLATLSSDSWGLGTGATSGAITFDDITATKTSDACPDCISCGACSDEVPTEFLVDVSGVADSTGTDCNNTNAVWTVPFISCQIGGISDDTPVARWQANFPETITCSGTKNITVQLDIKYSPSAGITIDVYLRDPSITYEIQWQATEVGGPKDCASLSGYALSYLTQFGGCCTGASSSCQVTAA